MKVPLVVVTGLSGAGKTTAIKALEDLGFFCVDNLPPPLIPGFLRLLYTSGQLQHGVALVVDIRARDFLNELWDALGEASSIFEVIVIFLEASSEVLINRFKVARRIHPLGAGIPLEKAISMERRLLSPLREKASFVVDTTALNVHQLKERISELLERFVERKFVIHFISFSYAYGIPHDAHIVFDVRFMPNPYFVEGLKRLSGRTEEVKRFLLGFDHVRGFLSTVQDIVDFLICRYKEVGLWYMVVAFGCTGGFHRSVFTVEYLYDVYKERKDVSVKKFHREME